MGQEKDQYRVRIILRHAMFSIMVAIAIAVMMNTIISVINQSDLPISFSSWRKVMAILVFPIMYCFFSAMKISHVLGDYDSRKQAAIQRAIANETAKQIEKPHIPVSPYPFSWKSIEALSKYVDEHYCHGVNIDFHPEISSDYIENENLEEFKEDLRTITFADNTQRKIWEYVWASLSSLYNRNAKRQNSLDQRNEPYFSTLNVELTLYKYIASAYTTSMMLPSDLCFEEVLRKINMDFIDKPRFALLRDVADKNEDMVGQILRIKADQCERCLIHGCNGRFKKLSDKLIDLVGPCCDDDIKTEEKVRQERRAQRLADIYFPEEARNEIIANLSPTTPLQDIINIISHPYWKSLIEAYLRIMGVPILAKDGQQEYFSEMDYRTITAECEEEIDEFHRWWKLEPDFSDVVKRNIKDEKYIKKYFADIILPLQSYLQYLYPPEGQGAEYRFSSALMRLAISDNCPSLPTLRKIFPNIVAYVDNRTATEHFDETLYEDTLFRALYEKSAQTKDDIYEPNSIFEISMIFEIIEHLCLAIDKSLRGNGLDFGFEEIQKHAGIHVVDDVKNLYEKYTLYDEDLFAAVEELKDDESSDDGNLVSGEMSERMKTYIDKAAPYIKNEIWQGTDKKEYAIFLKVLFCLAFHREWTNNVSWKKLPIYPMKDGVTPTIDQLKGALRSYDETSDGGVRSKFTELLK